MLLIHGKLIDQRAQRVQVLAKHCLTRPLDGKVVGGDGKRCQDQHHRQRYHQFEEREPPGPESRIPAFLITNRHTQSHPVPCPGSGNRCRKRSGRPSFGSPGRPAWSASPSPAFPSWDQPGPCAGTCTWSKPLLSTPHPSPTCRG